MRLSTQQDKWNSIVMLCTAIFAVLSCVLMVVFKMNEDFFDSHGRIGEQAQSQQEAIAQENTRLLTYKNNITVQMQDEGKKQIRIPLTQDLQKAKIQIREEFVKDKIIITFPNAKDAIAANSMITIDSGILEALGVYTQGEDACVEALLHDFYTYKYEVTQNEIVITFCPLREQYSHSAIVYFPYAQKNKFMIEDTQKQIRQMMEKMDCKLFFSQELAEEYTQAEITEFANRVQADLLMCFDVEEEANETSMTLTCNPEYFIPNFGSVQLAEVVAKELPQATNIGVKNVLKSDRQNADDMIAKATIPAINVDISYKNNSYNTLEADYLFHQKVLEGIKQCLDKISITYWTTDTQDK